MSRKFKRTDDGLELVLTPDDRTPTGALALLLEAIKLIEDAGCIDHIDCADEEDQALWADANANARRLVKQAARDQAAKMNEG